MQEINRFLERHPNFKKRLEEYNNWQSLRKPADYTHPALRDGFSCLLEHFQDSPFKIKKKLLSFLEVWDEFYGCQNLNAHTRKILSKCPKLKRELLEYNVLAKIQDCKVRNKSLI
ncbi:hypothetical protein ACKWTF_008442 [Chironomus riparius]